MPSSADTDSDEDDQAQDEPTATTQSASAAGASNDVTLAPKSIGVEPKFGPKKGKTTKRIEKQEAIELELRAQVCTT